MKLSEQTDMEILQAWRAGSSQAFGIFYDRYGELVYRLSLRILGSQQEAEDLTQEIFILLSRSSAYDSKRGSIAAFLTVLTRSRAIDRIRKTRSQQQHLQKWEQNISLEYDTRNSSLMETLSLAERSEKVKVALANLPDKHRQVLEMAYFDGLSQTEIANALDAPLGTVKSWARNGLIRLRESLKGTLEWDWSDMTQQNYPKNHANNYPPQWEELLAGYVLGDLEPEEVTEMHDLIATYPELISEIDGLQEALALLPLGLSESTPAVSLRDRIAASAVPQVEQALVESLVDTLAEPRIEDLLREESIIATGIKRSPSQRNLWKLAVVGLGSISAIALATLGFDNYQMRQQIATHQIELQKYRQAIAMLQSADNRMISLKGMGAIPTASGSVTIAPNEKAAMISIQNLIPISQENSYRLWAIVDGKKVDCAQFRPDDQGKVFVKVPLANALKQSTTVIITIEPNKDMPEPTGAMVMKGEV